jgi:hypothetical protein
MEPSDGTLEERYHALTTLLLADPAVTLGAAGRRGFGASTLQVGGKIFAMLSQGSLVVKLPRPRVDALVAAGTGTRFDPRRDGRQMKEWLVLAPAADQMWLSLAREAKAFVAHAPLDAGT